MAESKESESAEIQAKSPYSERDPSPSPEGKCEESHQKAEEKYHEPEESFESYYLKQVTAEFADDIDKIRNAPDFTEKSVPVLIQALKQSGAGFTDEQKRIIMGGKR
ncbi:hypothetical protein ACLMJK_000265 [Lecanora helva]